MTPETRYIESLFENGSVEIRAFIGALKWIGIFNEANSFRYSARWAERKCGDVYCTINPTCLPPTGKLTPFRRGSKDSDILRITRLPFDFDPDRPTGEAATKEQVTDALKCSEKCANFLTEFGWPEPIRAMSGNGYHVQYAVDLPNDPDTRNMLSAIYTGLKLRFTSETVKFDSTVKSPGQIMRLYGTTNQKSGRRATVAIPAELIKVSFRALTHLADEIRPPKKIEHEEHRESSELITGLDVVSLFKEMGLYKRVLKEHKHAVTCPWHYQHSGFDHPSKTDTVIWENPSTFHCSHNSCSSMNLADVAAVFGKNP